MQWPTVQSESLESPAKIRKVVAVLLGELTVEAGLGVPRDTTLSIEIATCVGAIHARKLDQTRPQAIGSKTCFKNPDRPPTPLAIDPAGTNTRQNLFDDLEPCDMSLSQTPGEVPSAEGAVPERAHYICEEFRRPCRSYFRENAGDHRLTVASRCDAIPTNQKRAPRGALFDFEH